MAIYTGLLSENKNGEAEVGRGGESVCRGGKQWKEGEVGKVV